MTPHSRSAVASCDHFEKRFARLIDRLFEHAVVPFLGAGISLQCRSQNHPHFEPSVEWMRKQLWQRFDDTASSSIDHAYGDATSTSDLGQLAEVVGWIHGESEIYKVIQIGCFQELEPAPAHAYLAYLAREGLINRVLSTNYDTCIEKAFIGTFPSDEPYHVPPGPDGVKTAGWSGPLAVITNLDEMRRQGSRTMTSCQRRRPILQLYKINGCAERYAESQTPSTPPPASQDGQRQGIRRTQADYIALTERQLQRFRENWVRDLFRDSVRRYSLFFVGFGGPEPQIRHTILELAEEFHATGHTHDGRATVGDAHFACSPSGKPFTSPALPFLGVYDRAPSFNQLQILHGFFSATRSGCSLSASAERLPGRCHMFSGEDAANFHEANCSSRSLPADLIFRRLFETAYARLLLHHSRQGSPFLFWLEQHAPNALALRASLCEWLGIGHGSERPWGRLHLLTEPLPSDKPTTVMQPMRLSTWIGIMQGLFDGTNGSILDRCLYFPLREDHLLVLATLCTLRVLFTMPGGNVLPVSDAINAVYAAEGERLKVELPTSDACRESLVSHVFLVGTNHLATVRHVARRDEGVGPLVRQIVVPSLESLPSVSRVIHKCGDHRYRVGRCVRIGAGSLLSQDSSSSLFAQFLGASTRRRRARLRPLNAKARDEC